MKMGRELKRVALNFEWPLHKVWEGFINPHYTAVKCAHCEGMGMSKQARHLHGQWYGNVEFSPLSTGSKLFTIDAPAVRAFAERQIKHSPGFYGIGEQAIVREAERLCRLFNGQWSHHLEQVDVNVLWSKGRLSDFNPNWRENHNEGLPPPLAHDVNIWSLSGMGHDSSNAWYCVRAKCERLGYTYECRNCWGDGEIWPSKEAEELYENWEQVEPSTGEGYQMWETVSEGSPVSPVFADKESFVNWLIAQGYSEGAAEQFAEVGHAFSLMIANGRIYENLEGLNAAHDEE
jgi:hypothetical protein